ncbi:MAG: hypothetical protein K0Q50_1267 [Vampirovibrio sp.]|jgi:hypothetical protein|nr:hypothetical protein [Vampirovibrio sp.]
MTFIDPTGFTSYSAYQPMPPGGNGGPPAPSIESQCFGGFPPTGGGFGGGPQFNYGMPSQQPQQDPMGGFSELIGQFMQLFMVAFMGGDMGFGGAPPVKEPPGGDVEDPDLEEPGSHGGDDEVEQPAGDPQLEAIDGEDPKTNTGALNILNAYSSELPTKSGKIKLSELKKFVKSPPADVPEEVVTAAQTMIDNPELYNLICLKSGSTPEKGFKTSVLDTDWSNTKVDIDSLESYDDNVDAVKTVKKNLGVLKTLSPDGTASTNDWFSVDDLKDVALGKVSNSKLKDPEMQAAALKLLSDEDTLEELAGDDEFIGETDLNNYINNNK